MKKRIKAPRPAKRLMVPPTNAVGVISAPVPRAPKLGEQVAQIMDLSRLRRMMQRGVPG